MKMLEKLILDKLKCADTKQYGFDLLVKEYHERVYWHIRKIVLNHEDSDDLVQEVFIKVWKKIDTFRGEALLFTWIYRIATNTSLSFIKKSRIKALLSLSSIQLDLEKTLHSSLSLDADQILVQLQESIIKLPLKQRVVFNMRYFEELKFKEIAFITNTSVGAAKTNYHLAQKKVKKDLEEI